MIILKKWRVLFFLCVAGWYVYQCHQKESVIQVFRPPLANSALIKIFELDEQAGDLLYGKKKDPSVFFQMDEGACIYRMKVSKDGRYIGCRLRDKVEVYDVAAHRKLGSFTGKLSDVRSFDFSPDGKTVAVVSNHRWDSCIQIFNLHTGQTVQEYSLDDWDTRLNVCSYSPSGTYLAVPFNSPERGYNVFIYDLSSGKYSSVKDTWAGGFEWMNDTIVLGVKRKTTGGRSSIIIQKVNLTDKTVREGEWAFPGDVSGISVSPDRSLLALGGEPRWSENKKMGNYCVGVFDLTTNKIIARYDFDARNDRLLGLHRRGHGATMTWLPEGNRLLLGSADTWLDWPIDGKEAVPFIRGDFESATACSPRVGVIACRHLEYNKQLGKSLYGVGLWEIGKSEFGNHSGLKDVTVLSGKKPDPRAFTNDASQFPRTEAMGSNQPVDTVAKQRWTDGVWDGEWRDSCGDLYSISLNLKRAGSDVSGQVTWTLKETEGRFERAKLGHPMTEFVEGTYDEVDNGLSLHGVRLTSNLLRLCRYHLTLSEDLKQLSGFASAGGDHRISFSASRAVSNPTWATKKSGLEGSWQGDWKDKSGYHFSFLITLRPTSDKELSGQIEWTLRASPRQSDRKKVGRQGIEFVEGTYDGVRNEITLRGVREDDPYLVIGLDTYKLSLSENADRLTGKSKAGGSWSGNMSASRSVAKTSM